MANKNRLKEKILLSSINNYPTDSNILVNFLLSSIDLLTNKIKKKITIKNWFSIKEQILDDLRYNVGLDNIIANPVIHSETVGIIERDAYLIEKIIFETFKDIYVPAHLYLPKGIDFPAPTILHVPGHWVENSKMEPDLQKICIGLAKFGFIVLSIDPFEQGERRKGWRNHGHLETLLVGITQIGMMIYENIKAIDYLQSRKEVDSEKIGMIGISGGGSNTVYTMPFDTRIKVGIPICCSSTYPGLVRGHLAYNWNGGVDLCNQVPKVINTLSFSQLLALNAPRPLMLINAKDDLNFPIEPAQEVFEEAKTYFDLYGSDLITQTVVSGGHELGRDARQAVYGFLLKTLMNKGSGSPIIEPEIQIEEAPYDINYIDATADKNRAQTFKRKKNLPTYVFTNNKLKEIERPLRDMLLKKAKEKYKKPNSPKSQEEWNQKKIKNIKKITNRFVKTIDHSPLNPKIVSGIHIEGYFIERIIFESEKGIKLPGFLFLPDNWQTPNNVWICVDDFGKNGFIHNNFFDDLIEKKQAIFTVDLRGQGESLTIDFEASTLSYMIDRDMFSQQVFDILRTVEYLSTRATTGIQIDKQRIILYGSAVSGIIALFAGVIDDRIYGIFLENTITSFKDMLYSDSMLSPKIFLFDILADFEIDDIVSLAFPKPVTIIDCIDQKNKQLDEKELVKKYDLTKKVYNKFNKSNRFLLCNNKYNNNKEYIEKYFKYQQK